MSSAAAVDAADSSEQQVPQRVIIRASAGTGKTFRLTNQYLRQLLSGARPEQILATTFTRKAAGEILERNMLRLAEAALDDDRCRELAGHVSTPSLTRERCLTLLKELTRGLHRIRICTLDSFFSQIAISFGFEMGLPPDWTIVDDIDDVQLKNKAIEGVLRNESTADAVQLMHLLTKGETSRSVSELIRNLVSALYPVFQETAPEAWSAFPHSRLLSADRLQQAIEQLRAAELPKDKRFENARAGDLASAVAHDWENFVARGLAGRIAQGELSYYKKDFSEELRDVYQRLLSHAKAVIIDQVARQTEATYQLLCRFDLRYSQLKDDARVLQFSDVTRLLSDIATDNDVNRLAFRMDGSISHLLLDEFQDTSLAQWQVIRPFAEYVTKKRKGRSFFCVGDVKQAIYGWRGGVAEIFDAIEGQLKGLHRESLNQSYRSAPAIMEATNRIFHGLRSLTDADDDFESIREWCDRFQNHTTARTDLAGHATLETAPRADEDASQSDATLRYAAERVAELTRQAPQATVGVLARKNAVVSQLIFELRRLGVPASEEGGNPVTDGAGVQLIMSALQLADHPGNSVARFHVATSPLGQILEFTNHRSLYAAEALARRIRRRLQADGYGVVVQHWASRLSGLCVPRGQRRLAQLVELAYTWQSHATLRTSDFLHFVELKKVPDPTADRVRVMTVHQSKGLEFDIVILPDLDGRLIGQPDEFVVNKPSPTEPINRVCRYRNASIRELLPADFQKMFDDVRKTRLSEALCVLYVAVTRARHALHMVIAPSSEKEKNLPKTAAGLLRRALTDQGRAEPDRVLSEIGEANWWQQDVRTGTAQKASASDSPQPAGSHQAGEQEVGKHEVAEQGTSSDRAQSRVMFAPMTAGRSRGLSRKAPSKHQGSRLVRLSSVIRHGSVEAMDRGTLIHAWFELIEWLDDGSVPQDSELQSKADELKLTKLNVPELIGEFKEMLTSTRIAAGLSQQAYYSPEELNLPSDLRQKLKQADSSRIRLEVQNEHPFAVREGGEVISGFIDRLVLVYLDNQLAAADIVDFKTDTFAFDNSDVFQGRVQYYSDQLDSYRRVVAILYRLPVDSISARLFMLGAGKIANV